MRLTKSGALFRGRRFPCSIGKGGISSSKQEGDGATPTGVLRVTGMYFRQDRLAAPQPWAVPITLNDLWSDDSTAAEYNHHVRAPYAFSHERLRRADPLYDIVLTTDWNWPDAEPMKGSAIFLHQRRRAGFPTEGCIAFRRDHLIWIAQRIELGTQILVPNSLAY